MKTKKTQRTEPEVLYIWVWNGNKMVRKAYPYHKKEERKKKNG